MSHLLYYKALEADNAWQAELVRLFGKRAGDVRYTAKGNGEEDSSLRTLHDVAMDARNAWSNEQRKAR